MITGNQRSWHDPQWNVNRQPVLWDDRQCNERNFGGWHDQQCNENRSVIRIEKDWEEELILLCICVIFVNFVPVWFAQKLK